VSAGSRSARTRLTQYVSRRKHRAAVNPKGTCPTGKVRWGSAETAQAALAHRMLDGPGRARETRFYRCDECDGGYHLTSRPRWNP
jgi:hypothetical protein